MKNKKAKINKAAVIKYVVIGLVVVLLAGTLGSLFIKPDYSSSSGDYDVLLRKISRLQEKIDKLSGDSPCDVTTSEIIDAVVVNGEVRLPSEGLTYTLNEDAKSYTVSDVGFCMDKNVVVPRKYNGLPVTAIGDNAFEGSSLDSIVLYECVTSIGAEAFKGCSTRFVYIYSTTPITLGADAFPDTVQGYFVPLHNIEDYKADEGWAAYSDKVVAIETPEALNTNIVNFYNALFGYIQNLMDNDASLQQAIENLGGVDAYLLSLITELKPKYSEGLAYAVVEVDGILGFAVIGIGTCTDTDIVIPPMYSGYPVLSVADNAFIDNANITSVVIPESVVNIGIYAFYGCSNLTTITILSDTPPTLPFRGEGSPFDSNIMEYRVPSANIDAYKSFWNSSLGTSFGDKVKAIETLETLRAELEAVKQELAALKESQAESETTVSEGE